VKTDVQARLGKSTPGKWPDLETPNKKGRE